MAKTKIEVDLVVKGDDSVAQVEGKVVSLKQQLKNLKAELASGSLTGEAFDKAAKKAGELQDRIQDVSQRVKNLASDSQKLDGFISLTQGIVGGFAAVQGITALVGDENEDLQKTMVKLQAAMSALAGIQAVANTLNKDSAALTALTTIKMGAQTAATELYTFATGGATVATNAFRTALLLTGVGAFIVLLGLAAQKMGLFGDATDETTESLKRQAEAQEALANKFKEGDNELIARYSQERDIAKARAKLRGASNEELLKYDREFLLKKKGLLELEVTDNTISEDARRKAALAVDAINNELELKQLEVQQAKKDAILKKQDKKQVEAKKEVEVKQKEDKPENNLKLNPNLDIYETELEAWKKRKEFEKQQQDDEVKAWQEMYNAKVSIAQSSFDILNNLAELALGEQYKQTAIGKTLALSQIAIDTALAISALTKNSEANPLNAPTGGLAGAAQYLTGIARITANIVKAKNILSGGGTPSGSGGQGGYQQQSRSPNPSNFTPDIKTYQGKDTKVYVLETDISNAQNKVNRIKVNAELI